MSLARIILATFGLATGLGASSHLPWLGGTLPYETTPYFELDPRLGYETGDRYNALRGELDAGIADFAGLSLIGWMGSYTFDDASGQGHQVSASAAQALLRVRAVQASQWPVDLGAFVKVPLSVWHSGLVEYGVIAGKEAWDFELATNVSYSSLGGLRARVALLSPFLFPTFRLAAQYEFGDLASLAPWFAELRFSLPGDIDIQLGGNYNEVSGLRAALRLSYQIFQDP